MPFWSVEIARFRLPGLNETPLTLFGSLRVSIVTLALAKEFLEIRHTKQDNVVQLMIDSAEDFIAKHLCVEFASAARQEDLDGGGAYLLLGFRPATVLTSVTDRLGSTVMTAALIGDGRVGRADSNGVPLLRPEQLQDFNNAVYASNAARWPDGLKRFRVVYTAGHATLPAVLKGAILMMVYRAYQRRGGETSSGAAGMNFAWAALMDSEIAQMIQPYSRRRKIGIS